MNEKKNNDRPYFFLPDHAENEAAKEKDVQEVNENNEKSSTHEQQEERQHYYYSYGPYKSHGQPVYTEHSQDQSPTSLNHLDVEDSNKIEDSSAQVATILPSAHGHGHDNGQGGNHPRTGAWEFKPPKKRSSALSIFAAFMAGALIVGSLMFASDKMNLFTGSQVAANSLPSLMNSNNGGVRTTSLDVTGSNTIAKVAEYANPAVVLIDAYTNRQQSNSRSNSSFFDDPFFRYFFGDSYQAPQQQSPQGQDQMVKIGAGSGFIYRDSGYILTNQHVIEGADEIKVTIEGHAKQYTAKLMGSSYDYDLAVLKIEGDKPFPYLPLGNSDELNVGDWVVAIGNPYGFNHTVTVGVLSAKERPIDIPDRNGQREYKHLLQTDASINPGNSGGPLINLDGEVIGINTAVSAQAQGIGFAIPTTTVFQLIDKLETGQEIPKEPAPYIGVELIDISPDWVEDLKLSNTEGAIVAGVQRGTPAFRAGIRQYDVITQVNGEHVVNSAELVEKVQSLKVNDNATFTIIRDGQPMDIDVTIGDRNTVNNN